MSEGLRLELGGLTRSRARNTLTRKEKWKMRLTENRERTHGEMMFDKLHNGDCSHNQFLCVCLYEKHTITAFFLVCTALWPPGSKQRLSRECSNRAQIESAAPGRPCAWLPHDTSPHPPGPASRQKCGVLGCAFSASAVRCFRFLTEYYDDCDPWSLHRGGLCWGCRHRIAAGELVGEQ